MPGEASELEEHLDAHIRKWLDHKFHIRDERLAYIGEKQAEHVQSSLFTSNHPLGQEGFVTPSTLNLISTLPFLRNLVEVDLSFGCPGPDLRYLEGLEQLECLVLDNCLLADGVVCPASGTIRILR